MDKELINYIEMVAIGGEHELIAFCVNSEYASALVGTLVTVYSIFNDNIITSYAHSTLMNEKLKEYVENKGTYGYVVESNDLCDIVLTNESILKHKLGKYAKLIYSSKQNMSTLVKCKETNKIYFIEDEYLEYKLDYTNMNFNLIDEI